MKTYHINEPQISLQQETLYKMKLIFNDFVFNMYTQ